ncbi:MAG: pyrroline-5-carboxylate reductase [Desulfobacterales bacterium]|nr:pyrroline-5-carboxylate reductase [Desulfobacterales bacterium]
MPPADKTIGFIGAGNMAEAFVGALTRSNIFSPSQIRASDISRDRLDFLKKTYGIGAVNNNFDLFTTSDIVVLAVKPQQIVQALVQIASQAAYSIPERKIVISIAAGTPIFKIEQALYAPLDAVMQRNLPIIRVMPNTPALVLSGMSGMSWNSHATGEDLKTARAILEAMGKVMDFEEDRLDAVTALSGSGPAYVFYLAEAMIEGGRAAGLDAQDAAALTLGTVKGALALLEQYGEAPEQLRRKVTSPGGTTEAAFKVLENNRVKKIIVEAILAAARRSKELSK